MFTPAFDEFLSKANLTPASLARDWAISEGHVSEMRSGKKTVSPAIAEVLAKALDVSTVDAFLDRDQAA